MDEKEFITVKRKDHKIIKPLGEHSYLVERDGEQYFLKLLGAKTKAFSDYKYALKRLKASGINMPKLIKIDKKIGAVLTEYIAGDSVFSKLVCEDLSETILKEIFDINYLCKMNKIALDYNPHNFVIKNDKLYYINYVFDAYSKDKDFSENGIKLWFYTKEFRDLLCYEGYSVDQSRMKSDFQQNKDILLLVVKYYK